MMLMLILKDREKEEEQGKQETNFGNYQNVSNSKICLTRATITATKRRRRIRTKYE